MIPPLHILCAKLGVVAYTLDYAQPIVPDLSHLNGRVWRQWIWGDDGKGVGVVAFGFVSDGPEGNIATIRGTQTPDGSMVEWLDDFDAILEPCPFVIGATRSFSIRSEAALLETAATDATLARRQISDAMPSPSKPFSASSRNTSRR